MPQISPMFSFLSIFARPYSPFMQYYDHSYQLPTPYDYINSSQASSVFDYINSYQPSNYNYVGTYETNIYNQGAFNYSYTKPLLPSEMSKQQEPLLKLDTFSYSTPPKLNITSYQYNSPPKITDFSSNLTYSAETKTPATTFKYSTNVSGNIDNRYLQCKTLSEAEKLAQNDTNLERLSNVQGVAVVDSAFRTDIPYAKKGTTEILQDVAESLNTELQITSALATGHPNNPHGKDGYKSHHNAENPKIDLLVPSGYTSATFAEALHKTGKFSHILPEGDHIDVQINPEAYKNLKLS